MNSLVSTKKLKQLIVDFSELLITSANLIKKLNKNDEIQYFIENWLQANWEMIVEHFLCQENESLVILKKYGDGADDLYMSLLKGQQYYERVSLPSMRATHKIVCFPQNDSIKCVFSGELVNFPTEGLEFRSLTSTKRKNEHCQYSPPFDKVLLSEFSNEYVDNPTDEYPLESIVHINDLIFTLVEAVPIVDYYVERSDQRGQILS